MPRHDIAQEHALRAAVRRLQGGLDILTADDIPGVLGGTTDKIINCAVCYAVAAARKDLDIFTEVGQ